MNRGVCAAISGSAPLGAAGGRKRILIVEDEPLSALVLEQEVAQAGCQVVGPAGDLATACFLACEAHFDAALLDVNLRGRMSYPVAELLRARGIPFAFLTGYAPTLLPPNLQGCLIVQKPAAPGQIRRLCATLVA